jgi:DNA polymerase III delta prime subunit
MVSYKNLVDDFKRLAMNGSLSHAYLFYGEEKNGKEEKFIFTQSLANFLENGIFEEPVKLLSEVLVISSDSQPQSAEKNNKDTIGIDSIRSIKNFLWQKPANSSRRVVIVKDAEKLTSEAQNAALKIVEEPPESALIIFISNIGDNLFPALISRLQKVYFPGSAEKRKAGIGVNLPSKESLEEIIENNRIDEFFESLIDNLRKDPVKNSKQLKEALNRLVLMKEFNVNKRLQLRALKGFVSDILSE